MLNLNLLAECLLVIAAFVPPSAPDQRPVLQRLREADITFRGRDPMVGFCGAFLPVHGPRDVDSVVLPRSGFELDHLRLLGRLPYLSSVGSVRTLTETEYRVLAATVPRHVWLPSRVRMDDGTIKRSVRARRRSAAGADINGDGVVNEDDHEDWIQNSQNETPPRIHLDE